MSTMTRVLRHHGLNRLALIDPQPAVRRYVWDRSGAAPLFLRGRHASTCAVTRRRLLPRRRANPVRPVRQGRCRSVPRIVAWTRPSAQSRNPHTRPHWAQAVATRSRTTVRRALPAHSCGGIAFLFHLKLRADWRFYALARFGRKTNWFPVNAKSVVELVTELPRGSGERARGPAQIGGVPAADRGDDARRDDDNQFDGPVGISGRLEQPAPNRDVP